MSVKPRSQVMEAPLAVHGTPDHAELRRLGLRPAEILDFSSNINAYGPSPRVREAIAQTPLDRYPDNNSMALRAALAEQLGVSPSGILVANGSSELIWLACLAFIRPFDPVLILGPTFAEYARMAALMGARLNIHLTQEKDDFVLSPSEIRDILDSWRPRLVFLCSPNNPTGTFLDPSVVANWANNFPHTLFIVDESYSAFTSVNCSATAAKRDNVLGLRSMTKDYALAGLRLGYAVAAEELISALVRVRPPWSVNVLAQAAGLAALRDREHVQRSLELLSAAKDDLMAAIRDLGMRVLPSGAPFFLIRVGNAAAVRRALLHKGFLVRDCASFGLPECVRICTRRPDENDRLVSAFREVFHAG